MIKGIRTKELNNHLNKFSAGIRPFPGATVKQLEHYVLPTLTDDTPDVMIIHGRCNDIDPRGKLKEITPNEIATGFINIGKLCKEKGVNDVLISGIICRRNKYWNNKVIATNKILKQLCIEHQFTFIENENISVEQLWKDGIHLLESGKVILANNFINYINNLI